jgi:hypothetical protein
MYKTVDVIIDGALNGEYTFMTDVPLQRLVEKTGKRASENGLHTQMFVVQHDHPLAQPDPEECACAQYLTDHAPAWEWNAPGDVDS